VWARTDPFLFAFGLMVCRGFRLLAAPPAPEDAARLLPKARAFSAMDAAAADALRDALRVRILRYTVVPDRLLNAASGGAAVVQQPTARPAGPTVRCRYDRSTWTPGAAGPSRVLAGARGSASCTSRTSLSHQRTLNVSIRLEPPKFAAFGSIVDGCLAPCSAETQEPKGHAQRQVIDAAGRRAAKRNFGLRWFGLGGVGAWHSVCARARACACACVGAAQSAGLALAVSLRAVLLAAAGRCGQAGQATCGWPSCCRCVFSLYISRSRITGESGRHFP
jgi:hypothetical protein